MGPSRGTGPLSRAVCIRDAVRRVLWHSSPALARSVGFPCAQALDSMVLQVSAVLPRFYPEGTYQPFLPRFYPVLGG